ncbi:hypothetical protein PIB30_014577 [Stylosanthes scabra]|uniref:CRC domain-containing protein n=1 Tax=Stylosanthes scabra TaxID=79078 RepID=A0ABU6Q7P5_9FABA|nr:hypothetical protein [Stylosanthes scabra]
MASSSGNMNEEEGASDNNHGDLNKENNPSSSSINDGNCRCTCKKSKCVKFYCRCFNSGNFCNDSCSCKNCLNNEENKDAVEEIKKNIQLRDPEAFESKNLARTRNGCHCRKSECTLQYCVCKRNGVGCTLNCLCEGCKNEYGINPNPNHNNGSKNVETIMDNESSSGSSQSYHPAVHANSSIQLPDDELGNSNNVNNNNIHMPMPTNPVDSPYYNFLVHQNHVAAPYYDPLLTPVQIQSSRNNITEMQITDLFEDTNWQGQSSFLRTNPPFYYDNNVAELSSIPRIQSSQQYQPIQSHGFHQQGEESFGAMNLQYPFLSSSQQPNNGEATNMQLHLHPHLHGHGPSPPPTPDNEENHHHMMFLWQNNRPQ